MSHVELSPELRQASHTVSELTAAVEIILYGSGRQLNIDRLDLLEAIMPLTCDQQQKLIPFVLHRGLELNVFVRLIQAGLDANLFFSAVEAGAHPALPSVVFQELLGQLPPPVVQQMMSDPKAMVQVFRQVGTVGQLTTLLHEFVPEAVSVEEQDIQN